MSKHLPGPWQLEYSDYERGARVTDARGGLVAFFPAGPSDEDAVRLFLAAPAYHAAATEERLAALDDLIVFAVCEPCYANAPFVVSCRALLTELRAAREQAEGEAR